MLRIAMKGVLILILASICSGIKYDGLRVKFSYNVDRTGTNNFFSIPRTVSRAVCEGWLLTERPNGPMPELRMYCHKDYYVCGLFGPADFIAGLQVAIPVEIIKPELRLERYFKKWSPAACEGKPQKEFYIVTQYYTDEDFLKMGGPTIENGSTLQAGGVWFNDLDGNLMKMSTIESEIKPIFKRHLCTPYMGVHYYYNVTRAFDCSRIFLPFYGLVTDGELAGVGFQTQAQKPQVSPGNRDWFETLPPQRNATKLTMIDPPECLMDYNVNYGTLALHIYYMDKPWIIQCDKNKLQSFTDTANH